MAWQIDPAHSQVGFSVRHLMVSTVRGHFDVLRGSVELDEQHPENSWVQAEVDTTSISTREEHRDGHLRSPDFFDAEKYPIITFKSTKVESLGDENYRVTGNFDMHGVTKEVSFDVEYNGQRTHPAGGQRAGLSAKTTIDRKDFGLSYNAALESGGVMLGEKIKIEIDLELAPEPAAVAPAQAQA